MGFIGLMGLTGLIKFKVKITKKGYRVNPYNLFASFYLFTFLPFYFYLTQFFLKKSSNSLR